MIELVKHALAKATRLSLGQNKATAMENLAAACSVSRQTVVGWTGAGLPNKRAARALQRYVDSPEMRIAPAREPGESGVPGKHGCRYKKTAADLRRVDRRRYGRPKKTVRQKNSATAR